MSLDVSVKARKTVEVYEDNITYNLAPMYYKCIDIEGGLYALNGMKCRDAVPVLNRAIDDLTKNKEEYEKLNPENGWGSYDYLLRFLKNLRIACQENPSGKVSVI